MKPCWIIHQPDGEGILADMDGKNILFPEERIATSFLMSCFLYTQGFSVRKIADSSELIDAIWADGDDFVWIDQAHLKGEFQSVLFEAGTEMAGQL